MFLHLTPSIYTDAVVPEVGLPGMRKKSENDHENAKTKTEKMQKSENMQNFDATRVWLFSRPIYGNPPPRASRFKVI